MKAFALLFGIFALMLNITLSSMLSVKKCRKLLATSSHVALSNSSTKDQTHNTDHAADKACNFSVPVAAIEQNKELLIFIIPAKEFVTVSNHQYTQQYIDPPFAPPRQEKDFSRNLF